MGVSAWDPLEHYSRQKLLQEDWEVQLFKSWAHERDGSFKSVWDCFGERVKQVKYEEGEKQ